MIDPAGDFAEQLAVMRRRIDELERKAGQSPSIVESADYTPALSGITLGTGGLPSNTGRYRWVGGPNSGDTGHLDVWGTIVLGTTGEGITSPAAVGLPSIATGALSNFTIPSTIDVIASSVRYVNPSDNGYPGYLRYANTGSVQFFAWPANGAFAVDDDVSSVVPFTWGDSDSIRWHLSTPATRT